VQGGSKIVKVGAASQQISVAASDPLLYLPDGDVATMRRLVTVEALSPGWRDSFDDLVSRADHPERDGATAPPVPAWEGFRRMSVDRLDRETDLVTSVYLRPEEPAPLPAPLPGQYVTSRLAGIPVAVRSYSLSASAPDHYRTSVKRDSHGIASAYIATTLAVGDEVDVAAPRGEFVLDDGDEPVLLLSAGIGVTSVLAMLQSLAARHSTRAV